MTASLAVLQEALSGRYAVDREIGRGGMATVFLATDLRHSRPVAIKVLHPNLGAAVGSERFLVEISVVARLGHPHIVPLHDSGDASGLLYYVMPYVKGETVRERLRREGAFSPADALRIVHDVADALDYAHGAGVVHRDIKPENIMLDERHAMITDFGIARALTESTSPGLTETGILIGTPAYMSPEQVAGERKIDGRSDIYSLGCVMYEMLCGQPAFTGPTARALMAKRFSHAGPGMASLPGSVSSAIREIVTKAMCLDPAERFQSAREMRDAIDNVRSAGLSGNTRRNVLIGVGAALAVGLAAFAILKPSKGAEIAEVTRVASIGVLPFVNRSGDQKMEYFSDGLTDELISALSRVQGLQVAGRASSFAIKGKNLDAREAAAKLQVAYIVDAGVRSDTSRVRVTWQLIDASTGRGIGAGDIDGQMRDVISLQDSMAKKIVADLRPTFGGLAGNTTRKQQTSSYEAHDLYLKGHFFWNQRTAETMRQGIKYLKQAIEKDPTYALAWAELSSAYTLQPAFGDMNGDSVRKAARAAALQAVKLDPELAEAYTALGMNSDFNDWDYPKALTFMDKAIQLDPQNSSPHLFRAWPLVAMGRFEDALVELKKAQVLDPLSPIINTRVGTILQFAGRHEESVTELRKALDVDPTNVLARFELGRGLALLGRFDEAFKQFPDAIDAEAGYAMGLVAWAHGHAGRPEAAREIYKRLEARSRQRYMAHEGMVLAAIGMGDKSLALNLLERGLRARSFFLPVIHADPAFSSLWNEPRYKVVARAVGLPTN